MERTDYQEELTELIPALSDDALKQVVIYARALKSRPEGEPAWKVIQHAQELNFKKEDVEEMEQIIEEWLERVSDFPEVNLDE